MLFIRKLFLILYLGSFTQALSAKVAYISWMEQLGFYPIANQLVSVNLDNGNIITQKTFTGSFFNSLAINQQGNDLYVADIYLNRIIQVDTRDFAIKREWDALPIMPEKIIFNEANNHMYFANTRSAGTGQDLVYKIDLDSNQISTTNLPVNGLDVLGLFWSTHKKALVFKVHNANISQDEYYSFRPSDMQLIASGNTSSLYLHKKIFNDDGIHYYGYNSTIGSLEAYQLTDGTQFWSSPISFDLPIFFIIDFDANSLIVIDAQNTYQISKSDGSMISNTTSFSIQDADLIEINKASLFCITGFCNLTAPLEIERFSQIQHTFDIIFDNQIAGAQDFVFGNSIIQSVPLLSNIWIIILMLLLVTFSKYYKKSN